jgi:hypothetical protein
MNWRKKIGGIRMHRKPKFPPPEHITELRTANRRQLSIYIYIVRLQYPHTKVHTPQKDYPLATM